MTPEYYRKLNNLTYLQLSTQFHFTFSRLYDICNARKGSIKLHEANKLFVYSEGQITLVDLGWVDHFILP